MRFYSVFAMNPVPGLAGFGTPIFSDQTSYYVQVCRDGRIVGFEAVEILDGERHLSIPRMMFCIGDSENFAFFLDSEEVLFGSKAAVSSAIKDTIDLFFNRPFLLFDVSEFIEDDELRSIAFKAIEKVSDSFHAASRLDHWSRRDSKSTGSEVEDPVELAVEQGEADNYQEGDVSSPTATIESDLISPVLGFTNLTDRTGTATLAPLERGFGLTLGNSLRRVLMSAIRGAAITSVQIDNVLHEFSEIQGVKEDVTDVLLNLKGVAIRLEVDGPKRVSIHARGPGVVTAGDISKTNGLTILNEDHVICHLDEGADLYMELTVNTGRGYVSAEKNKPEDAPIGLMPIDAIYSPIKKVEYDVKPTREGRVLDYDKLTLRITTDGSIDPREALSRASGILQHQLSHLQADDQNVLLLDNQDARLDYLSSALEQPIDELELSIRSANALRNGDFVLVRDLVEATEAELLRTPNFGRKSLNEIREVLHSMGLHLGMDTAKMSSRRHSQVSTQN